MEKQGLDFCKKEEGLLHEMEKQEKFMPKEFTAETMNWEEEEEEEEEHRGEKAARQMEIAVASKGFPSVHSLSSEDILNTDLYKALTMSSASVESTNYQKVDRISSLPDDIRCHILSFLPSKCSVSTSFLSRNWRNLWKYVPTVIIDYKQELENGHVQFVGHPVSPTENHHSFVNLANHLLLCRDDHVRNLRLHSEVLTDLFYFDLWIEAAIRRQVCEIDISLCQDIPWDPLLNLCSCQTLEVLKLCGYINVREAMVFSFHHHHLKVLHLGKMELAIMEIIYSGCPNLEELVLDFELESSYKKSYEISVPTLKRLSIRCRSVHLQMRNELPEISEPVDLHCEFEIGSPNLESLHIAGPEFCYNMVKLPFRKATVDCETSHYFKRSTCFEELIDARANSDSPYLSVGLHMTTKMALYLLGSFVQ